jgi:hypothetical protein
MISGLTMPRKKASHGLSGAREIDASANRDGAVFLDRRVEAGGIDQLAVEQHVVAVG